MEPRYLRNLGALSEEECQKLREKSVFLAGCGGLGGHLLEYFLRLGVGSITVCDGDTFDETNLNRQLLCTRETIGLPKTQAALQRAQAVNPHVTLRAIPTFLTGENADGLLAGHDLVLDALDSIASRRLLAAACARLGIPMVHGAVQGWYAQIAVLPPGSPLLDEIYPPQQTEAAENSCLSFTPALCAAIQAAEGAKLLCGRQPALEDQLLFADLKTQNYTVFSL